RLAAVDEADQADDGVAVGDPLLELRADLLIGEIEDLLVIDAIAALAQDLAGQVAIALQVAGGGADEDAALGHGSRGLPTRRPAVAEMRPFAIARRLPAKGPDRVGSILRPGPTRRNAAVPSRPSRPLSPARPRRHDRPD